jgi:hypothetical protein
LPAAERAKLLTDLELAPGWMRPLLRELTQNAPARAESQVAGEVAASGRKRSAMR